MLEHKEARILTLNSKNIVAKGFLLEKASKQTVDQIIKSWITRIQDVMLYPGRPEYKVKFHKLHEPKRILCDLEIRLKFRKWTATSTDPTIFGALDKVLENLRMTVVDGKEKDALPISTPLDALADRRKTASAI